MKFWLHATKKQKKKLSPRAISDREADAEQLRGIGDELKALAFIASTRKNDALKFARPLKNLFLELFQGNFGLKSNHPVEAPPPLRPYLQLQLYLHCWGPSFNLVRLTVERKVCARLSFPTCLFCCFFLRPENI